MTSNNILSFITELNAKIELKCKSIIGEIDGKRGVVGKDTIKQYLSELVNVVRNEKIKVENDMCFTPTTNTTQNFDSTIDSSNENSINLETNTEVLTTDDNTLTETKSQTDLKVLEKRFEKRFNKLEDMIKSVMNVSTNKVVKNHRNSSQRAPKRCWSCGKLGHISVKCWQNSANTLRHPNNRRFAQQNNNQTNHHLFRSPQNFLVSPMQYHNPFQRMTPPVPPIPPFPPFLRDLQFRNR